MKTCSHLPKKDFTSVMSAFTWLSACSQFGSHSHFNPPLPAQCEGSFSDTTISDSVGCQLQIMWHSPLLRFWWIFISRSCKSAIQRQRVTHIVHTLWWCTTSTKWEHWRGLFHFLARSAWVDCQVAWWEHIRFVRRFLCMMSNRWHEDAGVTSLFWCLITFFVDCHLRSWLRFCHTWMPLLFSASAMSVSSSTGSPIISKYQTSPVNFTYMASLANCYVYLIINTQQRYHSFKSLWTLWCTGKFIHITLFLSVLKVKQTCHCCIMQLLLFFLLLLLL